MTGKGRELDAEARPQPRRWTLAVLTLSLAAAFLAAALLAGSAAGHRSDDRVPASARISSIPALEQQALAAINKLRHSKGLTKLKMNAALSLAALGHSQSMAQHGFFRHDGWDGSPFWTRIKPTYRPQHGKYWSVGENLVWGAPDLFADEAVEIWMNSPPHRENLLKPSWREVGLGAVHVLHAPGVYRARDVTILTADFGVR
jgi:uncharacterized protein YkwD